MPVFFQYRGCVEGWVDVEGVQIVIWGLPIGWVDSSRLFVALQGLVDVRPGLEYVSKIIPSLGDSVVGLSSLEALAKECISLVKARFAVPAARRKALDRPLCNFIDSPTEAIFELSGI